MRYESSNAGGLILQILVNNRWSFKGNVGFLKLQLRYYFLTIHGCVRSILSSARCPDCGMYITGKVFDRGRWLGSIIRSSKLRMNILTSELLEEYAPVLVNNGDNLKITGNCCYYILVLLEPIGLSDLIMCGNSDWSLTWDLNHPLLQLQNALLVKMERRREQRHSYYWCKVFRRCEKGIVTAVLIVEALKRKRIMKEIFIHIFTGSRKASVMHGFEYHIMEEGLVQYKVETILQHILVSNWWETQDGLMAVQPCFPLSRNPPLESHVNQIGVLTEWEFMFSRVAGVPSGVLRGMSRVQKGVKLVKFRHNFERALSARGRSGSTFVSESIISSWEFEVGYVIRTRVVQLAIHGITALDMRMRGTLLDSHIMFFFSCSWSYEICPQNIADISSDKNSAGIGFCDNRWNTSVRHFIEKEAYAYLIQPTNTAHDIWIIMHTLGVSITTVGDGNCKLETIRNSLKLGTYLLILECTPSSKLDSLLTSGYLQVKSVQFEYVRQLKNLNSNAGSSLRAELMVANRVQELSISVVSWSSFYYLDTSFNASVDPLEMRYILTDYNFISKFELLASSEAINLLTARIGFQLQLHMTGYYKKVHMTIHVQTSTGNEEYRLRGAYTVKWPILFDIEYGYYGPVTKLEPCSLLENDQWVMNFYLKSTSATFTFTTGFEMRWQPQ